MKTLHTLLALMLTLGLPAMAQTPAPRLAPEPKPSLGTNLNGPTDWNTEIPFVDAFRFARKWISQQQGAAWDKGPQLNLDDHGWVKSLEPGCWAETPLLTVSGRMPAGTYTLLYEGEGRIELGGSHQVQIVEEMPGRITYDIVPQPTNGDGSLFLSIRETDPENYIRNIRFILPGHEETYAQEPFRPGFLAMWKGVTTLRFMDWANTNNSLLSKWIDRPTMESAVWTGQGGVPIEVMIDLSNQLKASPWFCMPHLADDEFVRNYATLVKEKLDPSLKIYVEFSNEVWNNQFTQTRWAGEQGIAAGYGDRPWEAGWRFYAHRSVEIFKIWEEVFGGTDRLVRVLASQAGNAHVAGQILAFEEAGFQADALAIAPYVSFNIPLRSDNPQTPTAEVVATWTTDQVIEYMMGVQMLQVVKWIDEHKAAADKYGLKLVGYEGGQHAVGVAGGENNEQLTALLLDANRSKGMGDIYKAYFKAWQDGGGDVMAHFSSIGRWSKWGSWGIMEYYDSNPEEYPKFLKTMDWAKSLGQKVGTP